MIVLRRYRVQVTAKCLVPASSLQPADQPEHETEPTENQPRERGKTIKRVEERQKRFQVDLLCNLSTKEQEKKK